VQPTQNVLKPKKSTFIGTRLVGAGTFFCGLAGAALLVVLLVPEDSVPPLLKGGGLALALGIAAAGIGFSWYAASVAYRKERYEFSETKIRCEKGGLFSQQVTDLEVSNITHVKLHLPWLRWRFFGVGNVRIESAGSASSEITLRLIREPEAAWDRIRELMKSNGFALQQTELLHEEQPAPAGVLLDCLGMALSAVFAVSLVGGEFLVEFARGAEGFGGGPLVFLVLGSLVAGGGFIALALHWLDLSRRTYRVFDDCVIYEEGFLTRTNAFLPGENIADSSTNRSLIDQILGLYSVSVSCQGSGSELRFRRLRRGEELSETIDRLVEQLRQRPTHGTASPEQVQGEPGSTVLPTASPGRQPVPGVPPEDAWTAELRMDKRRALIPLLLLFPIFPVWVVATGAALLRTSVTSFSVRPSSVRSTYKFLTVRQVEFSYDKITGVVVVRSPWDRLFGTVTVRLWSIGSGQPMSLQHVRQASLNLEALLRQAGIPRSAAQSEVPEAFGLRTWVAARLPLLCVAGTIASVLAVLTLVQHWAFSLGLVPLGSLLLLSLVYESLWCRSQQLRFHQEHLEAETGILVRRHTHIAFHDVKKVALTRYPGGDVGNLQFFAAGEQVPSNQAGAQGNQGGAGGGGLGLTPYGVTLRFIDGIEELRPRIDVMLEHATPPARGGIGSEVLRESQPALANSLVALVLGSLVLLPLALLLPITLPWTVLAVRRRRYRIETGRVVYESGVLYRRHESVLWSRIDALRRKRGFLNTMLGNGSVTLLTAGSSKPDLVLSAMPDCDDFYAELLENYGGSGSGRSGA